MAELELDIKEIETDTNNLETYWDRRNKQMLSDRDRINLVKDIVTTDKIKWYTNEPKVFYETATSLISSYPPRFRIPLTINYTPEEKEKISKAERLCLGIYRSFGNSLIGPHSYWLRELAYWILSGWYSVFVWIKKGENGLEFHADLFDPITVYPQWDSDGLCKCPRSFEVDRGTARQIVQGFANKGLEFQYRESDTETVKIINYWRKEDKEVYNAVLVNGQVIKNLTKESFKHIPIFVGAIGVPERTSPDWTTRIGENIIASNRDMYDYENQMVSLMATIMAETAYPNLVSKTRTGERITKDGMQGYGQEYPLKTGETLDLLKHAATPAEVNNLLAWANNRKQKGSIPDVVYGGIPFELSGFAISQLMASIRYKIAPYLVTLESVIGQVMSELLTQYKTGRYSKVTLSTVDPRQLQKGLFFVEDFDKEDVPDHRFVEISIPITSAMDKTQQMLYARQALQPPQLLSRETLWDEVLDVQDSEQEYARIVQDQTLELLLKDPTLSRINILKELVEKEKSYRAEGNISYANVIHQYIMGLEMQLGMRQGIPVTGKEGGVSPEAMPPEMMGASPDVMRSIMGVSPPGLSRRPQTPEERQASEGRKGMLVSPSGGTLL